MKNRPINIIIMISYIAGSYLWTSSKIHVIWILTTLRNLRKVSRENGCRKMQIPNGLFSSVQLSFRTFLETKYKKPWDCPYTCNVILNVAVAWTVGIFLLPIPQVPILGPENIVMTFLAPPRHKPDYKTVFKIRCILFLSHFTITLPFGKRKRTLTRVIRQWRQPM
jgi:hypothetical protein